MNWFHMLPHDLTATAYMAGSEAAWDRQRALDVIKFLEEKGFQILGVDIWIPTDPGPTIPAKFVYDWSIDIERRSKKFLTPTEFVLNFSWDYTDEINIRREPFFNITAESGV